MACFYVYTTIVYVLELYFIINYENLPMQYTEIFFSDLKIENFHQKVSFYIFIIFAQNIDCGFTLEPPRRDGSNEYLQSMSWDQK